MSFLKASGIAAALLMLTPAVSHARPLFNQRNLCPNAVALGEYLADTYPELEIIGGWRNDRLPDHPSGHALDVMIPNYSSPAGHELGDRINADLLAQRDRFGVKYTLWQVRDHYNHVHVTVY